MGVDARATAVFRSVEDDNKIGGIEKTAYRALKELLRSV